MQHLIFSQQNGVGCIRLNRPEALNALAYDMVEPLRAQLAAWNTDPHIHAITIDGVGERAFCAGGDVKSVYYAGQAGDDLTRRFFFEEYFLNYFISILSKSYISFLNKIVMGGGVGLSVHGSHRIVGDKTLMAMPETAIGLFPDIGSMHVLTRAPGLTGLFLALTGYRMNAPDALYAGFATHYVSNTDYAPMQQAIEAGEAPDTVLSRYATKPAIGFLEQHQADIDRLLAGDNLNTIRARAAQETGVVADALNHAFTHASPTSMALAHAQFYELQGADLKTVLKTDFRLSQFCMSRPDFYEGIRALLIDKDKNPRWNPSDWGGDLCDAITNAFETVPMGGDLTFP